MNPNDIYFKELKLPEVPLMDLDFVLKYDKWTDGGYHVWKFPRFYISNPALNALSLVHAHPGYAIFFNNDNTTPLTQRVIHSDLVTKEDPRLVKTLHGAEWRPATFGINFEITGATNDFYWYKLPEDCQPVPPVIKDDTPLWWAWLHGQHYGGRGAAGIPEGAVELARTTVTTHPTLVRADIPHATSFTCPPGQRRISCSIRYYENWTWEQALEIFKPLFVD